MDFLPSKNTPEGVLFGLDFSLDVVPFRFVGVFILGNNQPLFKTGIWSSGTSYLYLAMSEFFQHGAGKTKHNILICLDRIQKFVFAVPLDN